ncbi:hypothetical protein XELAEV_18021088mg [Xenopus laevis]|uniref:Uncharacterized protein n=1 Tax=Xenopus laevis TaxID=8355 RepID=A0A974DB24_XENLA|nr:hypothetical protein XELAEV_18021088mg [Xenopus laevis]
MAFLPCFTHGSVESYCMCTHKTSGKQRLSSCVSKSPKDISVRYNVDETTKEAERGCSLKSTNCR